MDSVPPGSADYRETAGEPILEAADDVGGVTAEQPKRPCRATRRIPFIADEHDPLVVPDRGLLEVALWIHPPLQDIAIDDERARNYSVTLPLFERPYINEDRSGSGCVVSLNGRQPADASPRLIKERVDADVQAT
jgi:hypothetical protein